MELLIVGLDGLSTNMLDRFGVDQGYFGKLSDQGASGDLWSVDSPTTLPAWTSFATGKDPGSHGIYGMMRQESDYETGPAGQNTTDPAVYDLVEDAVFVNLPGSERRRATATDSHVVSSFAARDKYDAVPKVLQSLNSFKSYRSTYDSDLKTKQDAYVDNVIDIADRRYEFATEAFGCLEPRVGFVLFSATDWIGHFLTNTSDNEQRGEWYRRVTERCITHAESLAEDTDATNVVLMSDHGFEHKHKTLHINDWFTSNGYAVTSASDASLLQRGLVLSAKGIAKRSDGAYELIRRAYNRVIGTESVKGVREAAQTAIDYPKSTAWELRYGNIFINDSQFISPKVTDSAETIRHLKNDLRSLKDGDGDSVYRDVLGTDEVYNNPSTDLLPDVIARPAPGYHPTRFSSPTGGITSPTDNFDHRYRGVFAADGPMFDTSKPVSDMSIIDVLPMLLSALEISAPSDVDGDVKRDILVNPSEVEARDPSSIEIDLKNSSEERARATKSRLKDLGYLE